MIRVYGIVTALIGVIQVVFNALWIPQTASPFVLPNWLIIFELGWSVISLDILIRRRPNSPIVLAATYILYSAFAVVYAWWLGTTYGRVTDDMIPVWWKIGGLSYGLWLIFGGLKAARTTRVTTRAD